MEESVRDPGAAHKDNFWPKSVGAVPRPGEQQQLAAAILEQHGRDYYAGVFAPGPVPLLDFTAGSDPGLVNPVRAFRPDGGAPTFRRDVPLLEYIELGEDALYPISKCYLDRELGRTFKADKLADITNIRRLGAAYDADILGRSDHHGRDDAPGFDKYTVSTRDTRRRDAREGRERFAGLGAWPWACFGPTGKLPRRWWQHEYAAAGWHHWTNT